MEKKKRKKKKSTHINLKEINSNITHYSRMHIINILLKILDLTKKHKK